ncbi:hypothetical protein GCM10011383_44950 [Hymenobacter cavernae]|uniref:Secretion system C-terminal sorting domain-containing protein n=1 Tax=Hymenobacter cavernae TaxID=2044852 RepID=A0ABQ1UW24_9BACT|nr:hypothetical protein GCM10011383_44950 [Hymenobacter cavernae]
MLTAGLLAGSFSVQAQALTKQWDKTFGGTAFDGLNALQPTKEGGYILSGSSASNVSNDKTQAGQGGQDYWLIKLDASGNKVWDHSFGGNADDVLLTLQQTPDGGYIVGGYSSSDRSGDKSQPSRGGQDYWVIKLDASGNKVWDRSFGGSAHDVLCALQLTSDGGYLLGGESYSGLNGDRTQATRGASDYWLIKLDANGNKLWDRAFGGISVDKMQALQPTLDGGYILGGYSYSIVSGDKTQPNQGTMADYWIVKVDVSGNKLWDRTFGGTDLDWLQTLVPTSDGGYLLGGRSFSDLGGDKTQANQGPTTTPDYWVVRLDASGNKVWDRTIGGAGYDQLHVLLPTPDSGYLLAGFSNSDISGDKTQAGKSKERHDYWLVKLDGQGNKLWDQVVGGAGIDQLYTLQPTPDGGYVAGGISNSGVSGDKTQPSQGDFDYWVVKLGPDVVTATEPLTASTTLSVYPNPAHNRLSVLLPAATPRTRLHLSLLDATGRIVYQQSLFVPSGTDLPVEVGQHSAGLYLLRVEGLDGFVATQRVVLE